MCEVSIKTALHIVYNKKTINNNNMLGIGDNFDYQGKKPNFARDCFSTLDKMKSYPETSIDPGHISFCGEDGKLYQYLPTNEVNEVTGKWRRLVDSILDANSENPIQNKVVVKRCEDLEKLISKSAEKIKGDIDIDLETMGGIIAAGMVDLNRNMDELEEAVSEALNSLNAGHVSLEEIKVNGHPITSSVNLTSTDIGLGNVDNTRDLDKPISTRVSAALTEKVDKSTRVNNKPLTQDIVIGKEDIGLGRVDNTGDLEKPISNAVQQALDDKVSKVPGKGLVEDADIAKLKKLYTKEEFDKLVDNVLQTLKKVGESHILRKDNPHNVTKDQVGLGSVDDTSDLDKPISRATQEALDKKADKNSIDSIVGSLNSLSSRFEETKKTVESVKVITDTLADLSEQQNSYGVEINYYSSEIRYTPLGNPKLHETLPIQNKMKPCILDDNGNVVKYLPIDSAWSDTDVNGSLGQVMVEIPEFWYYMENEPDKNKIIVKISEVKLPGFKKRPRSYISAYNATLDRSIVGPDGRVTGNLRNGLCSVCSIDPRYKGGPVNLLDWKSHVEGYSDSNSRQNDIIFHQSLLGKPTWDHYIDSETVSNSNVYYLNSMYSGWHKIDYPTYLTIFLLYVTEFKEIDLVKAVSGEHDRINDLDINILESGTGYPGYFYKYPATPRYIGDTNSIGGGSGSVRKEIGGGQYYYSIRYRGVENIVGDLAYCVLGFSFFRNNNTLSFKYFSPDMQDSTFLSNTGYSYGDSFTTLGITSLKLPGFIETLNCGIIGGKNLYNYGTYTSSTYFKSTMDYYGGGHLISEVDKLKLIFGDVKYFGNRTSFGKTVGCSSSYLTQSIINIQASDDFSLGTRLCYYPSESRPVDQYDHL